MYFKSDSILKTEKLALKLASKLTGTELVLFYGNLGTGKTTFIKSLASFFGISKNLVSSPTYSIMNFYDGTFPIYHYDMYRIKTEGELYELGFFDYIGNGIVLVEWSENIELFLPNYEPTIKIQISYNSTDEHIREFIITGAIVKNFFGSKNVLL